MANKTWSDLIKDHTILTIIVVVAFFLIEIEIFAVAVMKSGRQSWMNILNDSGEIIYQVKGTTLTNFNKYYFENTFGSIENYHVKLVNEDVPFPFRAWFTAAVGVPVGLILLLAFILQAVMVLLYGKKSGIDSDAINSGAINSGAINSGAINSDAINFGEDKNQLGASKGFGNFLDKISIIDKISGLNIFIIGFLILSGVMLYLVIPNMLTFLAKAGIETILNFKWFFIAVIAALFFLFTWFMYMKYQLAKKSMDAQTEIRKYEIKMEVAKYNARASYINAQATLEYKKNYDDKNTTTSAAASMIGYCNVDYEREEERGDKKTTELKDDQKND